MIRQCRVCGILAGGLVSHDIPMEAWLEPDRCPQCPPMPPAVCEILEAVLKEKSMHYKNGREARNGDKVVIVDGYAAPTVGILYDATAGNDFCNGKLATIRPNDPCPNLKECLHFDDVKALLATPKDEK